MFPCYTANKHMRLLTRVYSMYVALKPQGLGENGTVEAFENNAGT